MAFFCGSQAQNVQFHYDLGHNLSKDLSNRPAVTTTVEMFKPDKWGSTFLFTDIDYKNDGAVGAYWEISREFSILKINAGQPILNIMVVLQLANLQLDIMEIVFNMRLFLVVHGIGLIRISQKLSACNLCINTISKIKLQVHTHLMVSNLPKCGD